MLHMQDLYIYLVLAIKFQCYDIIFLKTIGFHRISKQVLNLQILCTIAVTTIWLIPGIMR